jgi:hypothetical protein
MKENVRQRNLSYPSEIFKREIVGMSDSVKPFVNCKQDALAKNNSTKYKQSLCLFNNVDLWKAD